MINMKSTLFYSILFASAIGGAGAVYVATPSKSDVEQAVMRAQEIARECMPERKMPKGPIYNSPAQDY